jgi:cysteine synthase A
VEATSGNTGIGLAMVAAAKGYKLIVIMPQVPSMYERYVTCKKFGAEVHLTAVNKDDMKKTIDLLLGYAKDLCAKNSNYWSPDQFENDANPLAHREHTGPEIWDQTGGKVDCFVAGMGTGGTICGVGTFLKSKKSDCRIVIVEPTESRAMVGETPKLHALTGMSGMALPLVEKLAPGQPWNGEKRGCIDEFAHCATPDGLATANKLAKTEGLLVGPTSGATVKVAIDIAKRPEMKGKTIVVLAASSGIRYVKHPMWGPECAEANAALPIPPDLASEVPVVRWRSEDYVPPEAK